MKWNHNRSWVITGMGFIVAACHGELMIDKSNDSAMGGGRNVSSSPISNGSGSPGVFPVGSPQRTGGTGGGATTTGVAGAGGVAKTGVAGSGGASHENPACSVPNGHVVPYSSADELEKRIVGDWVQCGPDASYPSEYGDGIRILPDQTWYSLVQNASCGYDQLDTGFQGYGTWTITENSPTSIQFDLLAIGGGGAPFFPSFTDTGQLMLDAGGLPTLYVRLPTMDGGTAGASCGE